MLASVGLALLLAAPGPAPSRKALLVGIDKYDSTSDRRLRQLRGAVSDARAMAALLRDKFHFEVRVLADGEARRDAILVAIRETLVEGTAPGDLRVFFFSGHGSQAANSESPEPDRLDETIVPFDAPAGARDIRDKELARELGAVIDRGGLLTVLLDSCHSGSGTRGVPELSQYPGEPKIAPIDPRSVADPSRPVPLELRGALVMTAAQDLEVALEVDIPNAGRRGAFAWSLIAALSDKDSATEPARRVFNRARQLMGKLSAQSPVIAGSLQRQRSSVFDAGPASITAEVEVPVTLKNDRIEVGAGSVPGLGVGSILERKAAASVRIEVTSVEGPSLSLGRLRDGSREALGAGGLFKVVEWAAAPGTNLLVDVNGAVEDGDLPRRVKALEGLRKKRGVVWIERPEDPQRTHWLEPDGDRSELWCLFSADGKATSLDDAGLASWTPPPGAPARLFAALPPPRSLADGLRRAWSRPGGLVQATSPRPRPDSTDTRRCLRAHGQAGYRLVGRLTEAGPTYAWLRSQSIAEATQGSAPAASDFASVAPSEGGIPAATDSLHGTAERLARVVGWLTLSSPAASDAKFPYRLVLLRVDGARRGDGDRVIDGEKYGLALRADPEALKRGIQRRWIYVFAMDSFGARHLLYPSVSLGDVENFLPLAGSAPEEILLVKEVLEVAPPYGTDTFFLLASDQKLPDPMALNAEGARTRGLKDDSHEGLPIDLLAPVMTRGIKTSPQPADWTLRRIAVISAAATP